MTEKRSRLLLIVLVLGQLLLLSAQVPAAGGSQTLLASAWLGGVGPLAATVDAAANGLGALGVYWTTRRRLLSDNAVLRRENATLRREAIKSLGVERDLDELAGAVAYARASQTGLQLADVVYADSASWLRTLLLRVEAGGVEHNQPVITDAGLVGRVVGVSGRYAKVQLIIDRAASVGVMVERTRRQGVVSGSRQGALRLDFIPLQADLVVGDQIVTAGIDGVYPRGIAVGRVTRVEPGSELFYRVALAPAVDVQSVDHVYVLAREPLPEELRSEGGELGVGSRESSEAQP